MAISYRQTFLSTRTAAVLDWGFLSTEGDPVFEASVTSAIFDMYGPDARTADDQLVDILSRKFGYSRKRILFYRAVYAVLTSNVYDPTGQDGHYAWCVRMLDREDVSVALATWADEL